MTFEFEQIAQESEIRNTVEYRQATELGGGLPIGNRVIDRERNATLYCLSVGTSPSENAKPDHYVLFYREQIVHIRAFADTQWVDDVGRVSTYRVVWLGIPTSLTENGDIHRLVEEALTLKRLSGRVPPALVKVEFDLTEGL